MNDQIEKEADQLMRFITSVGGSVDGYVKIDVANYIMENEPSTIFCRGILNRITFSPVTEKMCKYEAKPF